MGYSTDFFGEFTLSRNLTDVEKNYINKLSETRRMKRDVNKLMELYKGEFGHPTPKGNTPQDIYGNEGEYFVGGEGDFGQAHDESIIDYNEAPGQIGYASGIGMLNRWEENKKLIENGLCQPGLWCHWVVEGNTDENTETVVHTLQWDGGEKFYNYVEWLQYLIIHFFEPWGVKLDGEISWRGEEHDDVGLIQVIQNEIKIGKKTFLFN